MSVFTPGSQNRSLMECFHSIATIKIIWMTVIIKIEGRHSLARRDPEAFKKPSTMRFSYIHPRTEQAAEWRSDRARVVHQSG